MIVIDDPLTPRPLTKDEIERFKRMLPPVTVSCTKWHSFDIQSFLLQAAEKPKENPMIVIAEHEGVKLSLSGYLFEGPNDDPTRLIGHINDLDGEYVELETAWRQRCRQVEFDHHFPNLPETEAEILKVRREFSRNLLARELQPLSEQHS